MLTLDDIAAGAAEDAFDIIEKHYPDMVPGRVAHIDADFLAYMASYERKGEDSSLPDILYRVDVMIDDKRREAGAEFAVLHLTPNTSDKGGRYEVAIQQVYQDKRDGDSKPRYLEAARSYMADIKTNRVTGKAWHNAEADDGMAEASWKAYHAGEHGTVVIVTKDKDLRMCPGMHLEWDSGIIHDCGRDTFGYICIVERAGKKNPKTGKAKIEKKPYGFGTKWFWYQLLMGDTADNIQGCPKILNKKGDNLVGCSTVGAYNILADAESDRECLRRCMAAYKLSKYTHWNAEHGPVTWQDVFWSEAQMLWMQRTPGDINDVKKWMREMLNAEN